MRNLTGLDVSLWAAPPGARPLLISALTQDEQAELLERIREQAVTAESLQLGGETYETLLEPLATADGSRINMLLQRSLEQASGPLRQLELQILALSSGALLVAIVAASFFAGGVTRPLRRLAEAAQRIGRATTSPRSAWRRATRSASWPPPSTACAPGSASARSRSASRPATTP